MYSRNKVILLLYIKAVKINYRPIPWKYKLYDGKKAQCKLAEVDVK